MNEREFASMLAASLKSAKFSRSGRRWFEDCDEVISVISLQKSQWSPQYFINVGFWVKSLGAPSVLPKENECHIRIRADAAFGEMASEIATMCDLENDVSDADRASWIGRFVNDRLAPFVRRGSDVSSLRDMAREKCFVDGLVVRAAWPILGLESSGVET